MVKHLSIKVSGIVQGVSFRYFTKKQADMLNLTGFAKNEPDETVLIEIEGKEKNLNKFLTWCYKDSPYAKVKKIEVQEGKVKNFQDFSIY